MPSSPRPLASSCRLIAGNEQSSRKPQSRRSNELTTSPSGKAVTTESVRNLEDIGCAQTWQVSSHVESRSGANRQGVDAVVEYDAVNRCGVTLICGYRLPLRR